MASQDSPVNQDLQGHQDHQLIPMSATSRKEILDHLVLQVYKESLDRRETEEIPAPFVTP